MYLGKIVEIADGDEIFDNPRIRTRRRCFPRRRCLIPCWNVSANAS